MVVDARLATETGCGNAGAFLARQFSYISALLVQNALKLVLNSGHNKSQLSLNLVAAGDVRMRYETKRTL